MKFLVFQHVPHEHPGMISDFAGKNNINLDIVEFWKSYKIPDTSGYDALMIMGGPMGINDDKEIFPSKDDELKAIRDTVGKIPVLGFCLGSQLLAHALNARVYPNINIKGKHIKEIGFYDVRLTAVGKNDPLFKGFDESFKVLEWHGDAFDIPHGSRLLSTSKLCTNQAFNFENAYGVLFHFEFTPEMIKNQIDIDRDWIHKDFEMDEQKLLKEADEYFGQMQKQSELLLTNFLSLL